MSERSSSPRADLYISADVEADGPIPGPFSMLSFGFAVAGRFDGRRFERLDPQERTLYRELRPIGAQVDPEALAVAGLDRERLLAEGGEPEAVMPEAAAWVRRQAGQDRPVLVAYPLGFDWMFLHWYFTRYAPEGSPFGPSGHLDLKTLYARKAGVVLDRASRESIPAALRSDRRHTHHALEDAVEQADLFANLVEWRPSA